MMRRAQSLPTFSPIMGENEPRSEGMLSKEQIKKSSEIALKGYHVPAGWDEADWEYRKERCRKAKSEFVPNAVRNAADIKEALKLAEKIAKKVKK